MILSADEKFNTMMNEFIKVSRDNKDSLKEILEVLVKDRVLRDSERTAVLEQNNTTVNIASCIVEIMMEKGDEIHKTTINHLQTINPIVSSVPDLFSGLSVQNGKLNFSSFSVVSFGISKIYNI